MFYKYQFLILFLLTSCASKKEVIPGYSGPKLQEVLRKLEGKSRQEGLKILGKPVVAGRCKLLCGPKDVYRMIYPTKNMNKFYLELTASTDEKVDCVIFDFLPDLKTKKFVFRKGSYKIAKNCNNQGEIQFLNTHKFPER